MTQIPFCYTHYVSTGFFKGTSADQDRRFSDKELKLLKSMKFPPEFEKKVLLERPIYFLSFDEADDNFCRLI